MDDNPNSTLSILGGINFDPEEDDGLLQDPPPIQRPIVSVVSDSSSAINEANKKTDSPSSRNGESSETRELKTVAEEDDHNDGYDPKVDRGKRKLMGEEETSYSRKKKAFSNIVSGMQYQASAEESRHLQQYLGGPSSAAPVQRLNARQEGTFSQAYDDQHRPWLNPRYNHCDRAQRSISSTAPVLQPVPIYQPSHHNQNPRLNQIVRSGPTMNLQQQLRGPNHGSTSSTSDGNIFREPIGMERQRFLDAAPQNTYQQLSVTNQIQGHALVHHNYEPWRLQNIYPQHPSAYQMTNPMPGQMRPMQHSMMYSYQHPVANPQNLYQHPVAYTQAEQNQIQQMLQLAPQTQQPTQSQGFNAGPSSEQGQDQQQPR
ncbi:unnamed protein product [Arabidopsis arenosa]|uniref:Uncharacterized protein n=1 Tax=Arabidopsis arenosa TaxID=38785 RepID=A0A8S2AQE1_ARAAE|nr:unnamed protein product [Arabidopsis arenosa]